MSFYKIRTIKKPRKVHQCNLCLSAITGEHIQIKTVQDGVFYTMRMHEDCKIRVDTMCCHCEYSGDCQESVEQCYIDTYGIGRSQY